MINQNNIRSERPFYKKGDFYVSVILGIASILLSILALRQEKILSTQQEQIQGFDTLLKNSNIEIDTLGKAVSLLSQQLTVLHTQLQLNEEQQEITNKQDVYANDVNETKFRIAENNLKLLIWEPTTFKLLTDWGQDNRTDFLKRVEIIIAGELNNPFLLRNDTLARQWDNTYAKISNYYFVSGFYPSFQNPEQSERTLNFTWVNCFKNIGTLWQNTSNYLMMVTFHKDKNSKYIPWYFNTPDSSYNH